MAHGTLARWTTVTAAVLGLVAAPAAAGAATLRVAANGVDQAGCGPVAAPCRTIDRAVAHAAPGDTVMVAPGRYPPTTVSKRLTLVSSRGATVTVIDANGGAFAIDVVASDVTFGRPARGFTVTGATERGIRITNVSRVAIAGNDASGNGGGIFIDSGEDIEVAGNVVSHNTGIGIYAAHTARATFAGNLVQGNGADGIRAYFGDATIRGNTITANAGTGIEAVVDAGTVVRDNVAIGNGTGMQITGDVLVTRNSILGNRGTGLYAGGYQGSPGHLTASRNNFYDNGPCDVRLYRSGHVDARNNFWGTSAGTEVDPSCLGYAGTIDTEPFLRREIPLSPIKPRL